jgi:L-fuconolactonase
MKRRSLLTATLSATASLSLPRGLLAQAAAPFKLVDCHAHFYTNDPVRYPFDARTARDGADKAIAKAMTDPITPEVVFRFWDKAGVARGLGVQYSTTYYTDNRYLLDVAARHADRITPIVILEPTAPETPAKLEQMARQNRIAGVRFTGGPDASGTIPYLADAARGTWEMCNALGLSITLMPSSNVAAVALPLVRQFAERYANVVVVMDHIGFPAYAASPTTFGFTPEHLALADIDNIHYKFTTLLIARLLNDKASVKDFLEFAVGKFSADHMIWGTDYGNSEVEELALVQSALDAASGLRDDEQRAIFFETAGKLFVPGGRGA